MTKHLFFPEFHLCLGDNSDRGKYMVGVYEQTAIDTYTWGSMDRAFYCEEYLGNKREGSDTTEYHGYRIKNRQVEDWRTKNQWAEAGYRVKIGEHPTMMWKNFISAENNYQRGGLFGYYLPEQVERL